jgi:hypothetical protein
LVEDHNDHGIFEIGEERLIGQGIYIIHPAHRIGDPLDGELKDLGFNFQRAADQEGKGSNHDYCSDDQDHINNHASKLVICFESFLLRL